MDRLDGEERGVEGSKVELIKNRLRVSLVQFFETGLFEKVEFSKSAI